MPAIDTPALLPPRAGAPMLAALMASALLILWIGAYTELDLRLAGAMYDARTHSFPWRHAWLTEQFAHGLLKQTLTVLAAFAILPCAGEFLLRRCYLRPWWRLRLRCLAACALLIPTATSLLKQASKSHCPWDLERFGGSQQYYRLLDHIPAWVEAGKCLPGGHASTALWLVGIGVFWLPHRPRTAMAASAVSVMFGAALGWLQQMRGAHFLTHTLWSVWIACAIAAGLLWLQSQRSLQPDGQRRIYRQHDHDAAEQLLP